MPHNSCTHGVAPVYLTFSWILIANKIKLDYLKSLSPQTQLHCSNSTVNRKYVYTIMRAKDGHVALEVDKSEISCNTAL